MVLFRHLHDAKSQGVLSFGQDDGGRVLLRVVSESHGEVGGVSDDHIGAGDLLHHALAGLGLLAVATWLGNIGKNNKMFLLPMGFMIIVTICSLLVNTKNQIAVISAGGADWGPYVQAILGILLVVLAVILAIEGIATIAKKKQRA